MTLWIAGQYISGEWPDIVWQFAVGFGATGGTCSCSCLLLLRAWPVSKPLKRWYVVPFLSKKSEFRVPSNRRRASSIT